MGWRSMGSGLHNPWHRASYVLAIVLGRPAASEGWVFLLEMVALHCTIDLLSAGTDWTECGARAKVSL